MQYVRWQNCWRSDRVFEILRHLQSLPRLYSSCLYAMDSLWKIRCSQKENLFSLFAYGNRCYLGRYEWIHPTTNIHIERIKFDWISFVILPICIWLKMDHIYFVLSQFLRLTIMYFLVFWWFLFPAASMAEYSGHVFTMNWNACFDTADTIMKIYFYWFTCIGLAAVTIGSHPKDFSFWRKPVNVGDWTSFLLDWIMILSSVSIMPLYLYLGIPLGKQVMIKQMPVSSTFSSFVLIYRIWKNMGPTTILLIMATLSTASSLAGVAVNGFFLHQGNQSYHALMGLLFGGQQFILAYCFYLVVDPDDDKNNVKGEETPLIWGWIYIYIYIYHYY